jgi:hypothetical protein
VRVVRCCDTLKNDNLERIEGIEPSWLAWEARTLPLSYTRAVSALAHILTAFLQRQNNITDVLSGLNRFMRQRDVGQGKRPADGVL